MPIVNSGCFICDHVSSLTQDTADSTTCHEELESGRHSHSETTPVDTGHNTQQHRMLSQWKQATTSVSLYEDHSLVAGDNFAVGDICLRVCLYIG